mmetsp:Transcript_14445/g.17258  ORF Transcript_14445/g.17258 Transcript_14445/m.17258 type:complete len:102 (+) Transcript_14445:19-324(+)
MVERQLLESSIVRADSSSKGLVLFVLNVLLPGTGTIMSSCMDSQRSQVNALALVFGVMQMTMSILVVGWLWSAFHGYAMYIESCQQPSKIVRQSEGSDEDE